MEVEDASRSLLPVEEEEDRRCRYPTGEKDRWK